MAETKTSVGRTMGRAFIKAIAVEVALLGLAPLAHASVVFDVSRVMTTEPNPVFLQGSFTTDNGLDTLTSYSITVPASDSFGGFSYTPTNSSLYTNGIPGQSALTLFRLDSGGNELQFSFGAPLSSTGAMLTSGTTSFEQEASTTYRLLSGNVVAQSSGTPPPTAVPEPMSLSLVGAGLLGMAALASRRRRA